jgi:hypothetical protein
VEGSIGLLIIAAACGESSPATNGNMTGGRSGAAEGGEAGGSAAAGKTVQAGDAGSTVGGGGDTAEGGSDARSGGEGGDDRPSSAGRVTGQGGAAGKPINGEAGDVAKGGSSGKESADGGEGTITPPWVEVIDLPADIPAFEAGSRLRARVYVSEDGSRSFAGWHDTKLGLDCRFHPIQLDSNPIGEYCVPETSFRTIDQSVQSYADASCTVAAVDVVTCDGVIPPYRLYTPDVVGGCGESPISSVYEVGEPIQAPYVRTAGTCNATGVPPQGEGWRPIAPADPATFVRANVRYVDLGDGLSLVRLRAEDGTSEVRQFSFENISCRAREITEGGVRCVPNASAAAGPFFTNSTCTRPALHRLGWCSSPFGVWTQYDPNQSCAVTSTLWDFRPIRTVMYFMDGASCRVWDESNPVSDLIELTPRDPTTVPALEVVRAGTGRLRNVVNRTGGGSSVMFDTIYDSVLGVECSPHVFEDGILRCVPTHAPLEGYFDSDCSTPAVLASTCAQPSYYVDWANGCGPTVRQVFTAGAYVDSVWRPEGEVCSYAPVDRPYRTLVPVPNDTFAVVTEELDRSAAPLRRP